MVCSKCAGSAVSWLTHPDTEALCPCPECQGSGIVSCCDMAGASMTEEALLAGMREIREIFQENIGKSVKNRG